MGKKVLSTTFMSNQGSRVRAARFGIRLANLVTVARAVNAKVVKVTVGMVVKPRAAEYNDTIKDTVKKFSNRTQEREVLRWLTR